VTDAQAVHAHYVAALTRRMQGAPAAVQRVLQGKLQRAAHATVGPERVEGLAHSGTGIPNPSPLARLHLHITQATGTPSGATRELRSAQGFRETWARVRAEEDVTEAVQRGPENAGPLNSHMLVLRSLGLLRELSPDYLRRFMAHADTLLWLDEAGGLLRPPAGKGKPGRQKK
jgi:hypothetical protein